MRLSVSFGRNDISSMTSQRPRRKVRHKRGSPPRETRRYYARCSPRSERGKKRFRRSSAGRTIKARLSRIGDPLFWIGNLFGSFPATKTGMTWLSSHSPPWQPIIQPTAQPSITPLTIAAPASQAATLPLAHPKPAVAIDAALSASPSSTHSL